jgi:hypothetical protein
MSAFADCGRRVVVPQRLPLGWSQLPDLNFDLGLSGWQCRTPLSALVVTVGESLPL